MRDDADEFVNARPRDGPRRRLMPQRINYFRSRNVKWAAFFMRVDEEIGVHGLLNPSPGSLCVASIPSFVPIAISLVAWSKTSAGTLVKILSRCGSVLAQRRKRTSLVL